MLPYKKTADYLETLVKRDAPAHAYIFYGPDEAAKKETAFWFAGKLLKSEPGKFHPDLFIIRPEADEELTINLVRQLKKFLVLRPYSADYKIAVIENAERLNPYAQNALLKMFEEAPAHAIIIISCRTIDSVLETIASRGIKLPFWRNAGVRTNDDKKFVPAFGELIKSDLGAKYLAVEKLGKYEPLEIFRSWLQFLRSKFLDNPEKTTAGLLKISQNIYFKLNETNFNPKFAYDELIINIESRK